MSSRALPPSTNPRHRAAPTQRHPAKRRFLEKVPGGTATREIRCSCTNRLRRLPMRLLVPAALLLLSTAPALAVQDTPTTMNGVETVCTGVGSAKDDPR